MNEDDQIVGAVTAELYHTGIRATAQGFTYNIGRIVSAAAPFVRRQLGSILRVRRIPELDFQQDLTFERALRIEALLREVAPAAPEAAEGGQAGEAAAPEEPEDEGQ